MELIMKSDHHVHVKINDQDHSLEQQQDDQLQQQQQHFHVLAVDDSLIDRKLLEKLLKVSSYKVTCVDSGDEALKYLGLVDDDVDKNSPASSSSSSSSPQSPAQEGLKVNLIMTDYCMPGMSGYDLLKRVKESSWKDVPVVIMSSENVPSRISKCLEGGAEEFLLKPLQLSDLKNLENYLLKPLDLSSCQSNTVTSSTAEDYFTANDDICSSDDNNNSMVELDSSKSNNNNSSIMISKRKAAVSPEPSERRPKAKGLAVV